jgi:uncharacterized integral membrane protein
MRRLRFLVVGVPSVVLCIVLALFVVENIRAERYTFLGNTFTGNVWWIVTGAALLGFLLAALLFVPGRISTGWRRRSLSRQADRREQDLTTVRAQQAQLRAELSQVTAERDHARDQEHAQLAAAALRHSAPPPVDAPAAGQPTPEDDLSRQSADKRVPRHLVGAFRSHLHNFVYGPPEPHTPMHVPLDPAMSLQQAPEIAADTAHTQEQAPAVHA